MSTDIRLAAERRAAVKADIESRRIAATNSRETTTLEMLNANVNYLITLMQKGDS